MQYVHLLLNLIFTEQFYILSDILLKDIMIFIFFYNKCINFYPIL